MPAHIEMMHSENPKKDLLDEIGNLKDVEIFHNQLLVAVYIRPNRTKGGIYLSDTTTAEDRFQGKVGMIVKMGPSAFVDPDQKWFNGVKMDVGNWIFFRPNAVGSEGALKLFGSGKKAQFDWNRV